MQLLAPAGLDIVLYRELDQLPPFNPDREAENESGPVSRFRAALKEAAVVFISTPEYAHGVPGVLKNALDWIVGSGELSRKPVVFVNASTRGVHAQESLRETVKTMDAILVPGAEVTVDLMGKNLSPSDIARSPEFAPSLQATLDRVVEFSRVSPASAR